MSDEFVLNKAPETKAPEILEDGSDHPARVVRVQKREMPFKDDDGNPVEKVEFTFELIGPEYEFTGREGDLMQRRVYGNTSTVFNDSVYCRLRSWVQEIMGADELAPGFVLRLPDLEGNECRVIVEINEYADKKAPRSTWVEGLDGVPVPPKKRVNRVTDVVRSSVSLSSASAAAPAAMTLNDTAQGSQESNLLDEEPF